MSSWKKIVQGATKPKDATPKSKYIDPIIQATFSSDGSLQEICIALGPRLRDANSIVVFKALLVVHTMLRSGSLTDVYGYLSSDPGVLGLKNVTSGPDIPRDLSYYALYLHTRLKAYGALKHDLIRDKSDRGNTTRLRNLTVAKGLLREVGIAEKLMSTLVQCKFYLDDAEDDITMSAFRFLVKDLLILFQAINEGVINVLEHYFEMSHVDAKTALQLYKDFCRDTEKVVAFLSIAKRLQHITNVPIPNLKHAPISLAGSLEEYLNDPNFEDNRLEYKEANKVADNNNTKQNRKATKASNEAVSKTSTTAETEATSTPDDSSKLAPSLPISSNSPAGPSLVDFFATIESEQTPMFGASGNSPTSSNFGQNPFNNLPNQFFPQQSGMIQPQITGLGQAAFGVASPIQSQPTGAFGIFAINQQPPSMLQAQPTGAFASFGVQQQPMVTGVFPPPAPLIPQNTASNPFRQSTLVPQITGANPFGHLLNAGNQGIEPSLPQQNAFPLQAQNTASPFLAVNQSPFPQPQTQPIQSLQPQPTSSVSFSTGVVPTSSSASFAPNTVPSHPFQTALSATPTGAFSAQLSLNPQPAFLTQDRTMNESPKPLMAQPTGSRNPFALQPSEMPPPPKPFVPSMNQLAAQSSFSVPSISTSPSDVSPTNPIVPTPTGNPFGLSMGNVASDFVFSNSQTSTTASAAPSSSSTVSPSINLPSTVSVSQPSETLHGGVAPSPTSFSPSSPLQPQQTGFGGSTVKPFVAESNFGKSLLTSLPEASSLAPTPTGFSSSGLSATSSSVVSNPFRSSTIPSNFTGSTALSSNVTGTDTGINGNFNGLGHGEPFKSMSFSLGDSSGSAMANSFPSQSVPFGHQSTQASLI